MSLWDYIVWPFARLMEFLYNWTQNYGVSVILFALVVNLILLPFMAKSKKSMMRTTRFQPKMKALEKKYADNKEKYQQEVAKLYREEGINPMSGCLWSMIPFPILIALYYIIRVPLRYFMSLSESVIAEITTLAGTLGFTAAEGSQAYEQIYLAKFIHEHWADFAGKFDGLIDLNYNFLHIDLAAQPSSLFSQFPGGGWPVWGALLLPIISAGIQFAMSLITMRTNGSTPNGSAKTMMYLMPLMSLWMGYILPSALCVYWIANSAFSLIQELTLNKYFNKKLDREETEKEKAAREKRYAKYQKQKELMAQQQASYNSGKKQNNQQGKKKQSSGEKKKNPGTNESGRVGQRPYARGRAYNESHYNDD